MRKVTIFCCTLFAAIAMQAQVIHVPGDYSTIQLGINAANDGDTVLVSDGIYYEQINFMGKKPLMVASQYLMDGDTSHIGNTIIDGSQISITDSGSIVYFIKGEDTTSVLCGFTIRNGTRGTKYILPVGSIGLAGGGVYISGAGAKIINNHISQNSITDTNAAVSMVCTGAGINSGTWAYDPRWVVIENNTIDHNVCRSDKNGQALGTGISAVCNVRIINNMISDNTSICTNNGSPVAAGFFAGGEASWFPLLSAVVQNNVIRNNHCEGNLGITAGAGGLLQAITGIVSHNIIENNSSFSAFNGGAGGIHFWAPRTGTLISDNTFRNNTCTGRGGGLEIEYSFENLNSDTVLVENNYFLGNEAILGGGLCSYNPMVAKNNVFSGNHATSRGGAIYMERLTTVSEYHTSILINNTISGNWSDGTGGAIFSKKTNPLIFNTIFWNDSSSMPENYEILIYPGDTADIAYSNIDEGKIAGVFNNGGGLINADPLFMDADLLTISQISPCYNTGTMAYTCDCGDVNNCPACDIAGEARPWYGSVDIGADEFHAPVGIFNQNTGEPGLTCIAHPNPFTTTTTFIYNLKEPCMVTISVFNSVGQLVGTPVNGYQQKGEQKVAWNVENLPSGVYFYRIEAGGNVGGGKVIQK